MAPGAADSSHDTPVPRDATTVATWPTRAILVALRLRFSADLSTREIERAVGRLHARIKAALVGATDARLIVIEPSPGVTGPPRVRRPGARLRAES